MSSIFPLCIHTLPNDNKSIMIRSTVTEYSFQMSVSSALTTTCVTSGPSHPGRVTSRIQGPGEFIIIPRRERSLDIGSGKPFTRQIPRQETFDSGQLNDNCKLRMRDKSSRQLKSTSFGRRKKENRDHRQNENYFDLFRHNTARPFTRYGSPKGRHPNSPVQDKP